MGDLGSPRAGGDATPRRRSDAVRQFHPALQTESERSERAERLHRSASRSPIEQVVPDGESHSAGASTQRQVTARATHHRVRGFRPQTPRR